MRLRFHQNNLLLLFTFYFLLFTLSGCGPTYPKEKVEESIINLCRKEYNVDVKVKIVGKTAGIYIPLDNLFDATLRPSTQAFDKVDGVALSVSRVSLSTDMPLDFYEIIAADKNVTGAEIVLIRYVKDMRRYLVSDISRGEFIQRMYVTLRFNPQAIVDKWLDEFTLDEIRLDWFLAEQIARRIKDRLQMDKSLKGPFKTIATKGEYITEDSKRSFKFTIDAVGLQDISGQERYDKILTTALTLTAAVLRAYEFSDFDFVSIYDITDDKKISVDKTTLENFRKKKAIIE